MIEILAFSSLVSLATLGILLLRRTRPESLRLWTYRYGSQKDVTTARLHLAKPPWLLWLLVLLITLAFAGAYYRDESPAVSHRATSEISVWVDRSLSTQLVLNEDAKLRKEIATELFEWSSKLKFIESTITWDEETSSWKPKVRFVLLSGIDEIADHLEADPQALGFNLSGESLRIAFEQRSPDTETRDQLLVVSDGQASSVQNLGRLSDLFRELTMVPVPPKVPVAHIDREWVPEGLARSWGLVPGAGAAIASASPWTLVPVGALSVPGNPDSAGRAAGPIGASIPPEARPGLFSASFLSSANATPKTLGLVSGRSGLAPDLAAQDRASSIFTHCSPYPSGPPELSPIADLQALAQFFSIKVRTLDCSERVEGAKRSQRELAPNELDEWSFRRSSVWLVPLEDSILNTFRFQQRLWWPSAYEESTDSIVYFTDPRSAQTGAGRIGTEAVIGSSIEPSILSVRETPVQLERDGVPLALLLAPPPPENPMDLSLRVDQSRDTTDAKQAQFKVFASAYDGTPLIYRLGEERVYYLRTPLAMPNSELGRTGFWPTFWLEALGESPLGTKGLVIHHASTPEELRLSSPKRFRSVAWEKSPQSEPMMSTLQPGLYLDEQEQVLHLIEHPPSERDGQFLTASELADVIRWGAQGDASPVERQSQSTSKQTPLHAVLAAAAGLLALGLYWLRLPVSRQADVQKRVLVILGLLLAAGESSSQAQGIVEAPSGLSFFRAQNERLPDPLSVPFRIAWCSDRNKDAIREGYAKARDLLERRGTIHLQQEPLFGACVPGGAEIWWTDSASEIDPDFLKFHVQSGGVFVVESYRKPSPNSPLPRELARLEELSVGLRWEQPEKRGMLYRSFYLLQTFDGCAPDESLMLTLRKKQTAKSPVGILTSASFFGMDTDCFGSDEDYRGRSFVNLMYTLLTMDYKEDQLQLPELLRRVRNLGLEP